MAAETATLHPLRVYLPPNLFPSPVIPDLPPDLFIVIMSSLESSHRLRTLLHFALASRKCYSFALPLLWKTIDLPHLFRAVAPTKGDKTDTFLRSGRISDKFRLAQRLFLSTRFHRAIVDAVIPYIRELHFKGASVEVQMELWSVLPAAINLNKLTLGRMKTPWNIPAHFRFPPNLSELTVNLEWISQEGGEESLWESHPMLHQSLELGGQETRFDAMEALFEAIDNADKLHAWFGKGCEKLWKELGRFPSALAKLASVSDSARHLSTLLQCSNGPYDNLQSLSTIYIRQDMWLNSSRRFDPSAFWEAIGAKLGGRSLKLILHMHSTHLFFDPLHLAKIPRNQKLELLFVAPHFGVAKENKLVKSKECLDQLPELKITFLMTRKAMSEMELSERAEMIFWLGMKTGKDKDRVRFVVDNEAVGTYGQLAFA